VWIYFPEQNSLPKYVGKVTTAAKDGSALRKCIAEELEISSRAISLNVNPKSIEYSEGSTITKDEWLNKYFLEKVVSEELRELNYKEDLTDEFYKVFEILENKIVVKMVSGVSSVQVKIVKMLIITELKRKK